MFFSIKEGDRPAYVKTLYFYVDRQIKTSDRGVSTQNGRKNEFSETGYKADEIRSQI